MTECTCNGLKRFTAIPGSKQSAIEFTTDKNGSTNEKNQR